MAREKNDPGAAPATRLALAQRALWEAEDVVALGPPGADVARLGVGAAWIPDAHERAAAKGVAVGGVAYAGAHEGALTYLPKGTRRRDYVLALACSVAPRVALVGAKKGGIKPGKKALAQRGTIRATAAGAHCQIVVADVEQVEAPALERWESRFEVEGLEMVSLPGTFAAGRLDEGTARLLEVLELPETGRLLDVGCGAGVLACVAKRRRPGLEVVASDADDFAVESTRRSAAANELAVEAMGSDVYANVPGRFDVIVTNPPFHRGVGTEYGTARRIAREAPTKLRRGGTLWMVANHFLPWGEVLEESFAEVERVHAGRRFKVWRATGARG